MTVNPCLCPAHFQILEFGTRTTKDICKLFAYAIAIGRVFQMSQENQVVKKENMLLLHEDA